MADNIAIRPSSATGAKAVAADDVGGVLYQVLKLAIGTDGVAQLVTAANRLPVVDGVAPPLGYEQATVTTADALPNIPTGAQSALVIPRAPIRWRDDGTNPTASSGMYLPADTPILYEGDLAAFQMVAVAGTVEVNISYYGEPA